MKNSSHLHRLHLTDTLNCQCRAPEETMEHSLLTCHNYMYDQERLVLLDELLAPELLCNIISILFCTLCHQRTLAFSNILLYNAGFCISNHILILWLTKYWSIFIRKAKLSRYVFVNDLQSSAVFKKNTRSKLVSTGGKVTLLGGLGRYLTRYLQLLLKCQRKQHFQGLWGRLGCNPLFWSYCWAR